MTGCRSPYWLPCKTLLLAPAQGTDVILDVTGPVSFALQTRQGPHDLGTIVVRGSNSAPIDAPIRPLPPANVPDPYRSGATRLPLVMQDGAMGGRHWGSDFWAFNDRSGLPERPWRRFACGETARIVMRNDTAFPHGIHLHGHHFHELGEDGSLGHYRDTNRGRTAAEPGHPLRVRQPRQVAPALPHPRAPGLGHEDLGGSRMKRALPVLALLWSAAAFGRPRARRPGYRQRAGFVQGALRLLSRREARRPVELAAARK